MVFIAKTFNETVDAFYELPDLVALSDMKSNEMKPQICKTKWWKIFELYFAVLDLFFEIVKLYKFLKFDWFFLRLSQAN